MNQIKRTRNIRYAFTLIELLVVIAIISLLAAILFPVYASVREKARQTVCASNVRQLGLGFMQYEQDYDESFPSTPNWGTGWASEIFSYVKSKAIYACPDDAAPLPALIPNTTVPVSATGVPISYATNSLVTAPISISIGNSLASVPVRPSDLSAPSSTVLLYEAGCQMTGDGSAITTGRGLWDPDNADPSLTTTIPYAARDYQDDSISSYGDHAPSESPIATARHARGSLAAPLNNPGADPAFTAGSNVYAFADGHVKFLAWATVSNGDNTSPGGRFSCVSPTAMAGTSYSATFCPK